jgi:predicted nucleotidyltransferase
MAQLELPNNSDLTQLPSIFNRYPEIQAVYLFGSVATHRTHNDSDLDLAIYPGTESLKSRKLQLLGELAVQGFCQVDLIFLDGRDIVLDHEAIVHNKIIYQKPDYDAGSVFSLITRKYLDFLPYLSVHQQKLKEKILNG